MNAKSLARFLYAKVPGLAVIRFAVKDYIALHLAKPEFGGLGALPIEGGLIVDVGANRGQSIAAIRRLIPTSTIIAFEPEPRSVARIKERYAGDPAITIEDCALGSIQRNISLFVPKYGWWDCDGMSATDYSEATEWLRDQGRMMFFNANKLSVQEHRIECRALDSFSLSPAVIKLHAQGAELDVLKGAEVTIRLHRPALMSAFPSSEVHALLAHWNYRAYDYRAGVFVPGHAQQPRTFTWYLTEDHIAALRAKA